MITNSEALQNLVSSRTLITDFRLTTAKKNMIFSQKLGKLEFLLPFRPVYAGLPSGETSVLKESMPNDRKGFEMLPVSPTSPKTNPSARHKYSLQACKIGKHPAKTSYSTRHCNSNNSKFQIFSSFLSFFTSFAENCACSQ